MSFEVSNVEPLLNDFIRPRQHIRRNRQADLLGRFQIDDESNLRGCSTGRSAGLAPFRILSTKTATRRSARCRRLRRTSTHRWQQNLPEYKSRVAEFLPLGPLLVFD